MLKTVTFIPERDVCIFRMALGNQSFDNYQQIEWNSKNQYVFSLMDLQNGRSCRTYPYGNLHFKKAFRVGRGVLLAD